MDLITFPPGTLDVEWSSYPARSACCKNEDAVSVVKSLELGPLNYQGEDGPAASDAAMIALFESTDVAGLGDPDATESGFWHIEWDADLNQAVIVEGAGSGVGNSSHLYVETEHDPGDPYIVTLYRSKIAIRLAWQNEAIPWRAIDGNDCRLDYVLGSLALDDSGAETGTPTLTDQHVIVHPAAGDTVKWGEWIPIAEPTVNEEHYAAPGAAYADRECVGE
jgi:hypothetical protein